MGPERDGPSEEDCLPGSHPDEQVVSVAEEVRDVEVSGRDVTWSQRRHRARRWELMLLRGTRLHLVARSDRPPHPDFGRDAEGRPVLTYRACAGSRCRLRQLGAAGANRVLRGPAVGACTPVRAARDRSVVVVTLLGLRCPPRLRGVWSHHDGTAWTRMPTSGLATGDLDVLGSRVAWAERRGDVVRLRSSSKDGRPSTIYENSSSAKGLRSTIGSIQLSPFGIMFSIGVGAHGALLSHFWGLPGCGEGCASMWAAWRCLSSPSEPARCGSPVGPS
jgi:hypothetical protein